jgi:hypothetical protein
VIVGSALLSAGASAASAPNPHAGYQLNTHGTATRSAATTFVVPTINCTPDQPGGFQGMLDGVVLDTPKPSTFSPHNSAFGVALLCSGTTTDYLGAAQLNGTSQSTTLTILPGDTVTVSASESGTATSATITDTRGSQSQTFSGGGGTIVQVAVGSLAVNCQDTAKCSPVPKATRSTFTASSIDGKNLRAAHASRVNIVDHSGRVEVSSSTVNGAGTSFTTTWLRSCGFSSGVC